MYKSSIKFFILLFFVKVSIANEYIRNENLSKELLLCDKPSVDIATMLYFSEVSTQQIFDEQDIRNYTYHKTLTERESVEILEVLSNMKFQKINNKIAKEYFKPDLDARDQIHIQCHNDKYIIHFFPDVPPLDLWPHYFLIEKDNEYFGYYVSELIDFNNFIFSIFQDKELIKRHYSEAMYRALFGENGTFLNGENVDVE